MKVDEKVQKAEALQMKEVEEAEEVQKAEVDKAPKNEVVEG